MPKQQCGGSIGQMVHSGHFFVVLSKNMRFFFPKIKFCVKRLSYCSFTLKLIFLRSKIISHYRQFLVMTLCYRISIHLFRWQNGPLFFRQYYTKMATVQHKKPRNSAGWRWNSNRKRGPASYLRWYISTSLYIENRVESLWTSLCTLPRLRFPYMQEL